MSRNGAAPGRALTAKSQSARARAAVGYRWWLEKSALQGFLEIAQPVAATLDVENMGAVLQAIEDGGGQHIVAYPLLLDEPAINLEDDRDLLGRTRAQDHPIGLEPLVLADGKFAFLSTALVDQYPPQAKARRAALAEA